MDLTLLLIIILLLVLCGGGFLGYRHYYGRRGEYVEPDAVHRTLYDGPNAPHAPIQSVSASRSTGGRTVTSTTIVGDGTYRETVEPVEDVAPAVPVRAGGNFIWIVLLVILVVAAAGGLAYYNGYWW